MIGLYAHWDILSLILYLFLGIISAISLKKVKKMEAKSGKKQSILSLPYVIWWIIWVVIAAFRHITSGIGGSDAITYKTYFDICLNSNISSYFEHYDILYRIFTQVIRYFTDNHYIFLIIFHGIIAHSYILFLNEFCTKDSNKSPFILCAFLFILGFNTYRTMLSIALILYGLVLLNKEHKVLSFIFLFCTVFIQKASLFYAIFFFFYQINKNRKLKLKHYILFSIAATVLGKFVQSILLTDWGDSLQGAYSSYASRSLNASFFDNFWKIAFEQIVLLAVIIIFYKWINNHINNCETIEKERLNFIWTLCIFDFIMIPVTFILGIWRGYQYFYLPRLIMCGEIITIIKNHSSTLTSKIITIISSILFISWMIFRIYNIWEDACLMPYVFELFL